MEGDARENIEARLQCLRQIELLLDASVTVMQQYMTTVTATNMLVQLNLLKLWMKLFKRVKKCICTRKIDGVKLNLL